MILWRSMLNEPLLANLVQWARLSKSQRRVIAQREPVDPLSSWSAKQLSGILDGLPAPSRPPPLPSEWTTPMGPLALNLALHNLPRSAADATRRRQQAEAYWDLFHSAGVPCATNRNALPQSHFPLLIPASSREEVCRFLLSRGIGTSVFSWFNPSMASDAYPNAIRAAAKIVALPMGSSVGIDQIPEIVAGVKDGLGRIAA